MHLAIDTAREAGLPIVLAGEVNDPAEQQYFDEEIAPRLGEDVTWVGEADFNEKIDLLSRARCLLFPICWEEPFGMVMLEAMACGLRWSRFVGVRWPRSSRTVSAGSSATTSASLLTGSA